MYNIRALASLAPFMHYRAPGRLAPLLVGSGTRVPCLMAPYSCTRSPTPLGGGRVWVKGAKKGTIRLGALVEL
jgi:hypothetical protein